MEAGTGCGGGTDGRTGIHAHSISVTCPVLGEQQRGARRRASGHGRGGGQARSRDATRDAAACGSSGGGAGAHDRAVRSTSQRCDAERQQHGIGRGPGQRRVKRRGATARYDTWHGLGPEPRELMTVSRRPSPPQDSQTPRSVYKKEERHMRLRHNQGLLIPLTLD
jgi:hypothetical protein